MTRDHTQEKGMQPVIHSTVALLESSQHLFQEDQESDIPLHRCYQCSLAGEELEAPGRLTGALLSPGAELQHCSLGAVVWQSPAISGSHLKHHKMTNMSTTLVWNQTENTWTHRRTLTRDKTVVLSIFSPVWTAAISYRWVHSSWFQTWCYLKGRYVVLEKEIKMNGFNIRDLNDMIIQTETFFFFMTQ